MESRRQMLYYMNCYHPITVGEIVFAFGSKVFQYAKFDQVVARQLAFPVLRFIDKDGDIYRDSPTSSTFEINNKTYRI